MTTDVQGRLATRAELYSVTGGICLLLAQVIVVASMKDVMATLLISSLPFGIGMYYSMKSRWVSTPDPRSRDLFELLDSARSKRLTTATLESGLSGAENREEQLKLIADLQSQLVQLRKRVEGF